MKGVLGDLVPCLAHATVVIIHGNDVFDLFLIITRIVIKVELLSIFTKLGVDASSSSKLLEAAAGSVIQGR